MYMATIKENEDNMTIFYSKSSGEIISLATGIQDMNFFGKFKDDMSQITDFTIKPKDNLVIQNHTSFIIDVNTKEIMMKQQQNNYKVVSSS